MRLHQRATLVVALVLALTLAGMGLFHLAANARVPANTVFLDVWERSDLPVAEGFVDRTWVWGPEANTGELFEYYEEADDRSRLVQYFDKARMEVTTESDLTESSPWFVTNGLLPKELMTGNLQIGDDAFLHYFPAAINIAGDPIDVNAPTYAEVAPLMGEPPVSSGAVITTTIDGDANVGNDDRFAAYGVTAVHYIAETDHMIASVFWDLMNSEGPIWVDGQLGAGPLFPDPIFATGLPLTEAYWTNIMLDYQPTDVLIQVFERRVMTYTPSNDPGWKIETGNVGRHYFKWRYELIPESGMELPPEPGSPMPTATTPPTPAATATATLPSCCDLEYGLGEIGVAGKVPLGDDQIVDFLQPYVDVPVSTAIDEVVYGRAPYATIYTQKTFQMVVDFSPSDTVFYVADFNDGSAFISPLMDAHIGLFISHTWNARGTFWVKVWAIDPEAGIRTEIKTFDITVS